MKDANKMTDERLVEVIKNKNKELYREIIIRYEKKLLRYARYLVNDREKSADIVQESFIKAFVNLNSFNVKMKFSSWIYRIVHNQAVNIIHKYKKELPLLGNIDYDSGKNLELDFTNKEIKIRVNKCIAQLPLIYAEPLSLFYLEDKSYDEISDILRLPIGTVGTRINRAKSMMKIICQKIK